MNTYATATAVLAASAELGLPRIIVDTADGSLRASFILTDGGMIELGTMPRGVFNELQNKGYVDRLDDRNLLSTNRRAYAVRVTHGQAVQDPADDGG